MFIRLFVIIRMPREKLKAVSSFVIFLFRLLLHLFLTSRSYTNIKTNSASDISHHTRRNRIGESRKNFQFWASLVGNGNRRSYFRIFRSIVIFETVSVVVGILKRRVQIRKLFYFLLSVFVKLILPWEWTSVWMVARFVCFGYCPNW